MTREPRTGAEVQESTRAAFAETLETLAGMAAEALRGPATPSSPRVLKALEDVRWACAALLSRALLVEVDCADPLENPDAAFNAALAVMRRCIRQLATDACQVAATLSAATHELDAVAELPPGQEALDRLRGVVERLGETAREMTGDLHRAATDAAREPRQDAPQPESARAGTGVEEAR